MNNNIQIAFVVSSLIFANATISNAQQKGDRVVVTADVNTKISTKIVDKAYGGHIDTIMEVNGKWCALGRVKGWLPTQYVMNMDQAEKLYTARIEKNKDDFDAFATRGMIRFEKDQYEKALADLAESIRLQPRIPVTFNNRGVVLKSMGRYPEALVNLDAAIKLHPSYADAYENRGLVLVSMGQYAKAIENFNKAISYRKDNPWSFINRGTAKSNSGDHEGAKRDFLTALKMNKKISDAYVGLSVVYLAEGDLVKAMKFAEQAIKKNPKSGLAYNQRGWTHYKNGKLEDALFDFDKAIRFAPKLSIVFNNRAICYNDQGEYKKAIRDLNRALALQSNSAVAYTNRATSYMGLKDFEKANADLKKAVKLAPKFGDAAHAFGWFLATCPDDNYRNGESAVEHAKRACEIAKWENWSYIDTLAAAYAESGDFVKAIELSNKAIEIAPAEEIEGCKNRLAMFEKKQPYRSDFGKSAQKSG